MKHIKIRILAVIWVSVLALFTCSGLILNISLPLHFENQAREALEYEMEYINALQNSTDENYSDVDEYVGTYLSGEINFFDVSVGDEVGLKKSDDSANGYATPTQTNEKEVEEYEKSHYMEFGKCYVHRTENGYYVMVKYTDVFELSGELCETVMYINIAPLVKYTKTVNILLVVVFVFVLAVMSVIGLDLGNRIEHSQDVQRQFFQNSSHELKTPLMSIQGYAEGIETGVVDPQKSAEIILQESDRMTKLVEELLSISKIDAKRLNLKFEVTDLREILYDCLRTVEPTQKEAGVEITPIFCESPVFVSCDENQLSRAVTNILFNGIRHCRGEVEISCFTRGKNCVVRVLDNGEGLDENDLPHIFDRFYTGKNGNTGIGLALASEIVHLHKGKITAENEKSGAAFEIELPLAKKDD